MYNVRCLWCNEIFNTEIEFCGVQDCPKCGRPNKVGQCGE